MSMSCLQPMAQILAVFFIRELPQAMLAEKQRMRLRPIKILAHPFCIG